MGQSALDFTGGLFATADDAAFVQILLQDGGGEISHHLLFQVGPEHEQGEGAVEAHVQGFVEGIVVALDLGEVSHRVRVGWGAHGTRHPGGGPIGHEVEFVEERGLVPRGPLGVLQDGALPRLDGLTPLAIVEQALPRDSPGVAAAGAEERGVTPIPLIAAAELGNGQVPGEDDGNFPLFPRLQFHGDGNPRGCDLAHGRRPRVVHVVQRAVEGEILPDVPTVPVGPKAGAVGDAHTCLLARRDGETPLPALGHLILTVVEDDAHHFPALYLLDAGLVHVSAQEILLPPAAEHVLPGEENAHLHGCVRGIFHPPEEDGQGVTALLVIVGDDGRELLHGHARGEFLPVVQEPGAGVKRGVGARAHGIVPLPGGEKGLGRVGPQGLGDPLVALLHEDGEHVGG